MNRRHSIHIAVSRFLDSASKWWVSRLGRSNIEIIRHLRLSIRNVWFNILTHGINLGGGLLTAILLARLAGPEALGRYSFCGGLVSIFFAVTSFAVELLIVRDIAQDPKKAAHYLGNG